MKSAYYKALFQELLLSETEMKSAYRTLRLRMPPRAQNEKVKKDWGQSSQKVDF